jgi:hypothetical protein
MPEPWAGWFAAPAPFRRFMSRAVAALDVVPNAVTHNVIVNANAPAVIAVNSSNGVISSPSA